MISEDFRISESAFKTRRTTLRRETDPVQSGMVVPLQRDAVVDRATRNRDSRPLYRPAVRRAAHAQRTLNVHRSRNHSRWRLVEVLCVPSA